MEFRSGRFEIGKDKYVVTMLDPISATRLGVKLAKAFGPLMAPIAGEREAIDKLLQEELNGDKFTTLIEKFFTSLDESLVLEAIETLKQVTTVNGVPLDKIFDAHFMGNIASMIKWLGYAIKEQYADFSGAWELVTGLGVGSQVTKDSK